MQARVLALVSSLSLGCAPLLQRTLVAHVDPDFGPQVPAVIQAIGEWQEVARARGVPITIVVFVDWKVCTCDCKNEFTVHPLPIRLIRRSSGFANAAGFTDYHYDWSNSWIGSDIITLKIWNTTVRHEIGHDLGLPHLKEGTVMYEYVDVEDDPEHVTEEDGKWLAYFFMRSW